MCAVVPVTETPWLRGRAILTHGFSDTITLALIYLGLVDV